MASVKVQSWLVFVPDPLTPRVESNVIVPPLALLVGDQSENSSVPLPEMPGFALRRADKSNADTGPAPTPVSSSMWPLLRKMTLDASPGSNSGWLSAPPPDPGSAPTAGKVRTFSAAGAGRLESIVTRFAPSWTNTIVLLSGANDGY
jgi:hypothetical protein